MKIALCSRVDWANVGQELATALNTVGLDATSYHITPHPFNYDNQGICVDIDQMKQAISESDVWVIMHTDFSLIRNLGDGAFMLQLREDPNKRLIAFHGGSLYRQAFAQFNKKYSRTMHAIWIQTFDLLNKGSRAPEYWINMPIDIAKYEPLYDFCYPPKLYIAHHPSKPLAKNTELIVKVMSELTSEDVIFTWSEDTIPHHENLNRLRNCDIYIESQQMEQKGQPLGEFGISCLEASSLGKIVVTCSYSGELYEKTFGYKLPMVISNSETELKQKLSDLIAMPKQELMELKKNHRKWIENNHSYTAVGNYLKNLLLNLY